jgi:hypothetical protein
VLLKWNEENRESRPAPQIRIRNSLGEVKGVRCHSKRFSLKGAGAALERSGFRFVNMPYKRVARSMPPPPA